MKCFLSKQIQIHVTFLVYHNGIISIKVGYNILVVCSSRIGHNLYWLNIKFDGLLCQTLLASTFALSSKGLVKFILCSHGRTRTFAYRVYHGFRLTKRDNYFRVDSDHFKIEYHF